jgi:hypothetical protein
VLCILAQTECTDYKFHKVKNEHIYVEVYGILLEIHVEERKQMEEIFKIFYLFILFLFLFLYHYKLCICAYLQNKSER